MVKRDKKQQLAYDVLNKQLEIAGVPHTFEEFADENGEHYDPEYYQHYEINFEQHQQWLDYAVPLIKRKLRCNKYIAMMEAKALDLRYGLKFKDEDTHLFFSKN